MTRRSSANTGDSPAAERQGRIASLLRLMKGCGEGVFLVSSPPNVRYLSGFSGSSGCLLVSPEGVVLFTDGRYDTQARQQTQGIEVIVETRNVLQTVVDYLKKKRIRRIALEESHLSLAEHRFLRHALRGRRIGLLTGLVERLRAVKSAREVELIRRSVDLNSRAYVEACRRLRPTWTEKRLAAEIEYRLALLGADKAAFDTIVAGGPRSALPHASPGPHRLPLNALIVIDQGAILDGYTSDMTRTICLGRARPRELEMFRAVGEAQQAAIAAIKPGVKASSIDHKARQVLRRFKLENAFLHSTGHGLGLEIHERPRLGPGEDVRLAAGMVVTIEPGVYLPDIGGVRIEDVVVVTNSGCEVLTAAPKQLQISLGV